MTALALGLIYGGYKYGYDKGLEDMAGYMLRQQTEGGSQQNLYRRPLNDSEPGKMWIPDA